MTKLPSYLVKELEEILRENNVDKNPALVLEKIEECLDEYGFDDDPYDVLEAMCDRVTF